MNLIVARSNTGAIGKENKLLWRIREDLQHFKSVTYGHVVVMGRKTYESLPGGALPMRKNIVLTRREEYEADGAILLNSVHDVLKFQEENPDEQIFIIGGEEIYKAFMPYIKKIYLTQVDLEVEGDAYFHYDKATWIPEEPAKKGEHCHQVGFDYYFMTLSKENDK